ncbi:MAG: hypothetical protein HYX84_03175 [Chloroflexi bacterium]|nr:hypothetical protein [Chloroflexota bacterium]
MKFLKRLAISILAFFLTLFLIIFGLAFTINSTVLNPAFINRQIAELDISTLLNELTEQMSGASADGPSPEMTAAVTDTIAEVEPLLKERLGGLVTSTYDYLLGKRPNPDLAITLRSTIIKKDFFISVIDRLDIAPIASQLLIQELQFGQIPAEFQGYVKPALEKIVNDLKTWVKEQLDAAADPLLDYLLGQSDNFRVVINTDTLRTSLAKSIRETVLANPPPELSLLPPAEREAILNQFLPELERGLSAMLPPTIELNERILNPELKTGITEGIAEAEARLVEARQIIAYFQSAYKTLIVLILLLTAGIALIQRQVRGTSRTLGIVFLVYGSVEFGGLLVAQYFVGAQLRAQLTEIPASLQIWVAQLINHLIAPLTAFSLAALLVGVVLLVVSFVYPKRAIRN